MSQVPIFEKVRNDFGRNFHRTESSANGEFGADCAIFQPEFRHSDTGHPVLSINSSAAQVPIFEKERNDFGRNFIEKDHLQTINLALIALAFSLNSGICQTRGILRRKAGCLGMQDLEASGGLAEIMFQKAV